MVDIVFSLLQEGKITEAYQIVSSQLQQEPENKALYILLGLCLTASNINDLAYFWIKNGLEKITTDHPLYKSDLWRQAKVCLGNIAFSCKRDYNEAERFLSDAIENDYTISKPLN
ncbi:MAG: tetratricopeptide repeat protein, partial [Thermodesulfovibrionales bacterium]|nr:tetratricopeptide repeat protein [Thermodesulfovibrionales bacterium]